MSFRPLERSLLNKQIVVAFDDSREAAKLYSALQNNSVSFEEGGTPILLHCFKVEKEVVKHVSLRMRRWQNRTDEPRLSAEVKTTHPCGKNQNQSLCWKSMRAGS